MTKENLWPALIAAVGAADGAHAATHDEGNTSLTSEEVLSSIRLKAVLSGAELPIHQQGAVSKWTTQTRKETIQDIFRE